MSTTSTITETTPPAAAGAYAVPRVPASVDLRLDGNEGRLAPERLAALQASAARETARRYPDPAAFEAYLAEREGEPRERVLVTAGADDALLRLCLATLGPGAELVLPVPTFEMLPRYAGATGARLVEVPWPTPRYPIDAVLAAVTERTALIAVVSPNNPTGGVATADDLARLAEAAPRATILLDLAYVEFAGDEGRALAAAATRLPNVVRVRTLSKAWGLAGLRVGWAVGPRAVIEAMRGRGNPYPVAGPSLALARARLEAGADEVRAFAERVAFEREALRERLVRLGARCEPSQANFVLARVDDPDAVRSALLERGIAVRRFEGRARLADALRITCPGDEASFARLCDALDAALGAADDRGAGREPVAPAAAAEPVDPQPFERAEPGSRRARVERGTNETRVVATLDLDGTGTVDVRTGVGFLDHMLGAFARHAGFDLTLACTGDLEVDDHHTAEDCALVVGEALDRALGERRGIARFGSAYAPLDEALARAVVDLSGRPWPAVRLGLRRERLGELATENLTHVLNSLAIAARCNLNVRVLEGENDHHKAEAAFKACALAFRAAVRRDGTDRVPSTKGVLA